MCGLCKLNAAALDTTTACGYNGIDQHNLGLLPPLRGLILSYPILSGMRTSIAPIAGIDTAKARPQLPNSTIAPIAGIDISFLVFGIFLSPIAPHCGD